jgi:hypothetical protein
MDPFVKLPEFPFVICKVCRYAYTGKEIQQHLREHHKSIQATERSKIIATIQCITGTIQEQSDLVTWQKPPPTIDSIPGTIYPPATRRQAWLRRGRVFNCGWYDTRHKKALPRRAQIDQSPREGGNTQKRAIEAQQVPWHISVQYQRLFSNGPGSSWFEVGFGGQASQAAPEEAAIIDRMNRAMEQQQRRFKIEDKEKIKAADARMDTNPYLEHVGWATHLEEFNPEAMLRLTDPVSKHKHAL